MAKKSASECEAAPPSRKATTPTARWSTLARKASDLSRDQKFQQIQRPVRNILERSGLATVQQISRCWSATFSRNRSGWMQGVTKKKNFKKEGHLIPAKQRADPTARRKFLVERIAQSSAQARQPKEQAARSIRIIIKFHAELQRPSGLQADRAARLRRRGCALTSA